MKTLLLTLVLTGVAIAEEPIYLQPRSGYVPEWLVTTCTTSPVPNNSVPEPSSLVLLGLGSGLLALRRNRHAT